MEIVTRDKLIRIIQFTMEEYGMPENGDFLPAMDVLKLIEDAGYRKVDDLKKGDKDGRV